MKNLFETLKLKFKIKSIFIIYIIIGIGFGWSNLSLASDPWRIVWVLSFFTAMGVVRRSRDSGLLVESLRSSHSRIYATTLSILQHSWSDLCAMYLLVTSYVITHLVTVKNASLLIPTLEGKFSASFILALSVFYLLCQPLFIILWAHVGGRSVQPKLAVVILIFMCAFILPFDTVPELYSGLYPLRLIMNGSFLLDQWWFLSVLVNTIFQLYIWLRIVMDTGRSTFYLHRLEHWTFALLIVPLLYSLKLNTYLPTHEFSFVLFSFFFVLFILSDRWGDADSSPMMSKSTLTKWSLWPITLISCGVIGLAVISSGLLFGTNVLSFIRTYAITFVQVLTVLFLLEQSYLSRSKIKKLIFWLVILLQGGVMLLALKFTMSQQMALYYLTRLFAWGQSYFYEQQEMMYLESNALAWSWCYHIFWLLVAYFMWRAAVREQMKFYQKQAK